MYHTFLKKNRCYYPGTYIFAWSIVSPSKSETKIGLFVNGKATGHQAWAAQHGYQAASETAVSGFHKNAFKNILLIILIAAIKILILVLLFLLFVLGIKFESWSTG